MISPLSTTTILLTLTSHSWHFHPMSPTPHHVHPHSLLYLQLSIPLPSSTAILLICTTQARWVTSMNSASEYCIGNTCSVVKSPTFVYIVWPATFKLQIKLIELTSTYGDLWWEKGQMRGVPLPSKIPAAQTTELARVISTCADPSAREIPVWQTLTNHRLSADILFIVRH